MLPALTYSTREIDLKGFDAHVLSRGGHAWLKTDSLDSIFD